MTDERFWARVDRSGGDDACWPWTGKPENSGYAAILRTINGKPQRFLVHRYAWAQFNGMIVPDTGGLVVRHRCDTPLCCNPPLCLILGTHRDNMADCVERGRRRGGRRNGEVHPRSKLTDAQVAEMRADRWENGMKVLDLAAKYGVSKAQVSKVTRGVSRENETDLSTVVLTTEAIADIRATRERGEPLSVIAARHDISVVHVSHVVNRRGYS
jgi:hypothetical protein